MHNSDPPVVGYADENPAPARRMARGVKGRKCTTVTPRSSATLMRTRCRPPDGSGGQGTEMHNNQPPVVGYADENPVSPAGWLGGQGTEMHNNQPPVVGYADENPAPARRMARGVKGRKCTTINPRSSATLMRTRRRPAGWFGGQWPEMHNNQPPVVGYADENPAPARRMVRRSMARNAQQSTSGRRLR